MKAITKKKRKKATKKQKKMYCFVNQETDDKLCYNEQTWEYMNE